MVTLQAGGTTTQLPNPDLGDAEGLNVSVNYREAMNGKPYVYRKQTNDRNISLTWSNLNRGKLVELMEFFKAYIGQEITIVDHESVTWKAILTDDSVTVRTTKRVVPAGPGRQEAGEITLSFVGTRI